jgi:hypothetical protein
LLLATLVYFAALLVQVILQLTHLLYFLVKFGHFCLEVLLRRLLQYFVLFGHFWHLSLSSDRDFLVLRSLIVVELVNPGILIDVFWATTLLVFIAFLLLSWLVTLLTATASSSVAAIVLAGRLLLFGLLDGLSIVGGLAGFGSVLFRRVLVRFRVSLAHMVIVCILI